MESIHPKPLSTKIEPCDSEALSAKPCKPKTQNPGLARSQVDVRKVTPGMVKKAQDVLREHPKDSALETAVC